MRDAFICDGIRTPIGRYGGALSSVLKPRLMRQAALIRLLKHRVTI